LLQGEGRNVKVDVAGHGVVLYSAVSDGDRNGTQDVARALWSHVVQVAKILAAQVAHIESQERYVVEGVSVPSPVSRVVVPIPRTVQELLGEGPCGRKLEVVLMLYVKLHPTGGVGHDPITSDFSSQCVVDLGGQLVAIGAIPVLHGCESERASPHDSDTIVCRADGGDGVRQPQVVDSALMALIQGQGLRQGDREVGVRACASISAVYKDLTHLYFKENEAHLRSAEGARLARWTDERPHPCEEQEGPNLEACGT